MAQPLPSELQAFEPRLRVLPRTDNVREIQTRIRDT